MLIGSELCKSFSEKNGGWVFLLMGFSEALVEREKHKLKFSRRLAHFFFYQNT